MFCSSKVQSNTTQEIKTVDILNMAQELLSLSQEAECSHPSAKYTNFIPVNSDTYLT
jgi:hypothetical protein